MTVVLHRLINKSGRTIQAFLPGLARPDDAFARQWLDDAGWRLYMQMDIRDRCHCVLVARRLLAGGVTDRELIAAALLHDVGKSLLPFSAWQRVISHLWRPVGLPRTPLQPGLQGALQLREHHETLAVRMLTEAGVDSRVTAIISDLAAGADSDAVQQLREADQWT